MRIFGSDRMDGMLSKLGLQGGRGDHPSLDQQGDRAGAGEGRGAQLRHPQEHPEIRQRHERPAQGRVRAAQRVHGARRASARRSTTCATASSTTSSPAHIPEDAYPEQWDVAGLKEDVARLLNLDLPVDDWAKEEGIADEEIRERLRKAADEAYATRVEANSPEVMTYVEKQVLLQSLDHLWREHLVTLDHLRQVIGWRGYAQRDPLNEYKSEAFELFNGLIGHLREQVTGQLMRIEVVFQQPEPAELPPMFAQHLDPVTGENELAMPQGAAFGGRSGARLRGGRRGDRARGGARPERPVDLGPRRPQRALPLRLGQEVQALPRAVRGISSRPRAQCAVTETTPWSRRGAVPAALPSRPPRSRARRRTSRRGACSGAAAPRHRPSRSVQTRKARSAGRPRCRP